MLFLVDPSTTTMTKLRVLLIAVFFSNVLFSNAQGPLITWQKCLGGSGNDSAYAIARGPANGVVVAGSSASNDGDVDDRAFLFGILKSQVLRFIAVAI